MPSPTDTPGVVLPVPPPTTSVVARGRIRNASPGPMSSWLAHETSIDRLVFSIAIHPRRLHPMPSVRAFVTPPGHSLALATTTLHAPWPSLALRSASRIGSPLARTDPSEAHPSRAQTDLRQRRHHVASSRGARKRPNGHATTTARTRPYAGLPASHQTLDRLHAARNVPHARRLTTTTTCAKVEARAHR
jgi:hypothetical protein